MTLPVRAIVQYQGDSAHAQSNYVRGSIALRMRTGAPLPPHPPNRLGPPILNLPIMEDCRPAFSGQ